MKKAKVLIFISLVMSVVYLKNINLLAKEDMPMVVNVQSNKEELYIGEGIIIEVETDVEVKRKSRITIEIENLSSKQVKEVKLESLGVRHYAHIDTVDMGYGRYAIYSVMLDGDRMIFKNDNTVNVEIFTIINDEIESYKIINPIIDIEKNRGVIQKFTMGLEVEYVSKSLREKNGFKGDSLEVMLKSKDGKKIKINLYYDEEEKLFSIREEQGLGDNVGIFILENVDLKTYIDNGDEIYEKKVRTLELEGYDELAIEVVNRIEQLRSNRIKVNGIQLSSENTEKVIEEKKLIIKEAMTKEMVVEIPIQYVEYYKSIDKNSYLTIENDKISIHLPTNIGNEKLVSRLLENKKIGNVTIVIKVLHLSTPVEKINKFKGFESIDIENINQSFDIGIELIGYDINSNEKILDSSIIISLDDEMKIDIKNIKEKTNMFLLKKEFEYVPHIQEGNIVTIKTKDVGTLIESNKMEKYDDVKEEDWFYEDVTTVGSKKILKEIEYKKFFPKSRMTRVEVLRVVSGILNIPTVSVASDEEEYDDVSKDKWYYKDVMGAKYYGILGDLEDNKFQPGKLVTREEMAYFIGQILKKNNIPTTREFIYYDKKFDDYDEINSKFYNEIDLTYRTGVMRGMGTSYKPKELMSRAEISTVIVRLLKVIGYLN